MSEFYFDHTPSSSRAVSSHALLKSFQFVDKVLLSTNQWIKNFKFKAFAMETLRFLLFVTSICVFAEVNSLKREILIGKKIFYKKSLENIRYLNISFNHEKLNNF